jgi:hydroxyacylglutathione hydrolase
MRKDDLVLESFAVGSFRCNCSLIYSESTKEAIVVDPGNDLEQIMGLIKERSLNVVKLLHTHAHFDHIGQSAEVSRLTGATSHLHNEDMFLYEALAQQGMFFNQPVAKAGEIHSHLQDNESFSLESIHLKEFLHTIHTPGHTPGSCCFYTDFFDSPVLLAGDTLFQGSIGRTDLPGGDSNQIIKSIKTRLITLPSETQVITGHGPKTVIHKEKSHNPFLS